MSELDVLQRAHDLFAGHGAAVRFPGDAASPAAALQTGMRGELGVAMQRHDHAVQTVRAGQRAAADTDAELAGIVGRAQREHRSARDATGRILQEAHADAAFPGLSPLARREAARRQAGRLRASHRVVSGTHRSAARRAAQLRLLRYAAARRRARGLPPASGRAATAVRAALSRLGRPYVWGATGPDRFDCSGLVQWAYHQAGVDLQRTTYDQIHQGIAVPRSQVQPGDLVFPHAGHVQMAIGDGLVVEAPYSGANVRISHLGANIAIRRPC